MGFVGAGVLFSRIRPARLSNYSDRCERTIEEVAKALRADGGGAPEQTDRIPRGFTCLIPILRAAPMTRGDI